MKTVNIHASCVRLGRAGAAFGASPASGILLLGESGAGKSDLTLRLISAGALLVADDRVDLFVRGGSLHARAPAKIAGLVEIRGLGVVAIPYTEFARIVLVVSLVSKVERMPAHGRYAPPAALGLPRTTWPPSVRLAAHEVAAPQKVAAAAAAFEHGLFRDAVKPQ